MLKNTITILLLTLFFKAQAQNIYTLFKHKTSPKINSIKINSNDTTKMDTTLENINFYWIGGIIKNKYKLKADTFWNNKKSFGSIQGNPIAGLGTINQELLWDNVGWTRLSFNTSLTNSKNDTIKDFITFAKAGGNASLNTATPLLYWTNRAQRDKIALNIMLENRFGFSAPSLGTNTTDFKLVGNTKINASIVLMGSNNKLGLVVGGEGGIIYGKAIEIGEFTEKNKGVLPYVSGFVSIVIKENYYFTLQTKMVTAGNKIKKEVGNLATFGLNYRLN